MTQNRLRQRLEVWRRLVTLRKFRTSKVILDAAEDWLDKEIADLEGFLKSTSRTYYKIKMTTFRDAAI